MPLAPSPPPIPRRNILVQVSAPAMQRRGGAPEGVPHPKLEARGYPTLHAQTIQIGAGLKRIRGVCICVCLWVCGGGVCVCVGGKAKEREKEERDRF